MFALVLEGEYPISNMPSLYAADPIEFAKRYVKEMNVDAKEYCLSFAPFILRISVPAINLDEELVLVISN